MPGIGIIYYVESSFCEQERAYWTVRHDGVRQARARQDGHRARRGQHLDRESGQPVCRDRALRDGGHRSTSSRHDGARGTVSAVGVRIKINDAAVRDLERRVNAQVAPAGPAISRIANEGVGRPVPVLVSEISRALRRVGLEPNDKVVRSMAERISAGKSLDDLFD